MKNQHGWCECDLTNEMEGASRFVRQYMNEIYSISTEFITETTITNESLSTNGEKVQW